MVPCTSSEFPPVFEGSHSKITPASVLSCLPQSCSAAPICVQKGPHLRLPHVHSPVCLSSTSASLTPLSLSTRSSPHWEGSAPGANSSSSQHLKQGRHFLLGFFLDSLLVTLHASWWPHPSLDPSLLLLLKSRV